MIGEKKNKLNSLASYALRQRILYVCLFLILIISIGVDLGLAWFLKLITDIAVLHNNNKLFNVLLIGSSIMIAAVFVSYFGKMIKELISNRIRNDLRKDVFNHTLFLETEYYDNKHSGDLISRLTNDNNAIGNALSDTIYDLVRNPLLALLSFIFLLNIYWPLALICGLIGPLTLLLSKFFGNSIRKNSSHHQNQLGKINGFLQDVFSGRFIVRTFQLEKVILNKYKHFSDDIYEIEMKGSRLNAGLQAGASFIGHLSFQIAFGFGAYFVLKGELTIGGLIAVVQLLNNLTWPFTNLAGVWGSFQGSLAAADRTFDILKQPIISKENDPIKTEMYLQQIRFVNVNFSYNNGLTVFNNLNFSTPSGKMVAIVGPSGAGKTTLFKLMLGLYNVDGGEIKLNDRSISEMTTEEIAMYFSIVPQETYLFSGTIKENISFGKLNSTENEIIQAAKAANAHDFIMELPEKYDTEIGEIGNRLSGGQKQRISIARAVLKNAQILLLDEATASLDNESERLVQTALEQLMIGRTTFVIAHRLSTVQNADVILVIDQGEIVEMGTHSELYDRNGRYWKLYMKHFNSNEELKLEGE